jgi:hypothetical protein
MIRVHSILFLLVCNDDEEILFDIQSRIKINSKQTTTVAMTILEYLVRLY